ncbi:MAG: methylated-DNA--[protein]-cysteine S-methyltransferase [Myxococcales bacterium]|nr:methylated-DNA--[protein]-cysteine S-methyltransferase [Myxococcales bacterium]
MGKALACGRLDGSALGRGIWVAWSERGLTSLRFWNEASGEPQPFAEDFLEAQTIPAVYSENLERYLAREEVDPAALPVDPEGTPFQQRVWRAMRHIGRGQVRTYAGLASDVGSPRAMRAVGAANARNPIPIAIPCHRVVASGMALGGYSSGLDIKRYLLELEGARVVGDLVQPGQLSLL